MTEKNDDKSNFMIMVETTDDETVKQFVIHSKTKAESVSIGKDIINHLNYTTFKKWMILSTYEIESCEGCELDLCGQLDHMICPSGCLHDPKTCNECEEYK